jgi:Protein of unknown function (DUF3015)
MKPLSSWVLTLTGLVLIQAAGCTIKGTIKEITDTTSNVTGTTSGAAWWNEEGQIKPDLKAAAFATNNHNNLQQDIAAGRGEYLTSMSVLLGVPQDRQSAFFSAAQAGYAQAAERRPVQLETLLPFLQNIAFAFVQ